MVLLVGCGTEPVIDPDPDPVPPPPAPELWGVPISGGTMIATRDGNRAVIADPDRDRIVIVDLTRDAVIETIDLPAHSEPGRLVEDGAGRIHVALRRSGELLTLLTPGRERRAICGEPRGVAWDAKTDLVHVACSTGELISVPAAGGEPVRVLRLERDLRDVIVRDRSLVVTKFRTAELLEISAQGRITSRVSPPLTQRLAGDGEDLAPPDAGAPPTVAALPGVAWRTIALADGRLLMVHQRKVEKKLSTRPGGYGSSCGGGPVESAITIVDPRNRAFAVKPVLPGALPVDVAVHPTGEAIAIITAGDRAVQLIGAAQLHDPDDEDCGVGGNFQCHCILSGDFDEATLGTPTSVAYRPNGDLLAFYPEGPALVITGVTRRAVDLGGEPGLDSARTLFHGQTPIGIACASCHPEAREDGQVWSFEELGPRRTMSLGGGLLKRAPYHWSGDMTNLRVLLDDVLALRMSGAFVDDSTVTALGEWLDRIPAPKGVILDTEAVQRGQTLFTSQGLGCTTCHAVLDKLVDVGTGGVFKVPSLLGVDARAPYLHDGCAATLEDRFGPCGGGNSHGQTSLLTDAQRADLIAYLKSL